MTINDANEHEFELVRHRLHADDSIPPHTKGRIVLCKEANFGRSSTEVEWFDAETIETAGGWVVPETVNGFFYVLETLERVGRA